jgi:hypothetical protein
MTILCGKYFEIARAYAAPLGLWGGGGMAPAVSTAGDCGSSRRDGIRKTRRREYKKTGVQNTKYAGKKNSKY